MEFSSILTHIHKFSWVDNHFGYPFNAIRFLFSFLTQCLCIPLFIDSLLFNGARYFLVALIELDNGNNRTHTYVTTSLQANPLHIRHIWWWWWWQWWLKLTAKSYGSFIAYIVCFPQLMLYVFQIESTKLDQKFPERGFSLAWDPILCTIRQVIHERVHIAESQKFTNCHVYGVWYLFGSGVFEMWHCCHRIDCNTCNCNNSEWKTAFENEE